MTNNFSQIKNSIFQPAINQAQLEITLKMNDVLGLFCNLDTFSNTKSKIQWFFLYFGLLSKAPYFPYDITKHGLT